MMYLYTDTLQLEIVDALSTVEGLSEAVTVKPLSAVDRNENHLLITDDGIHSPLPWNHTEPPVLFGTVPFVSNDLIAMVLAKLGYEQEALDFCQNEALRECIRCRLQLISLNLDFHIEFKDLGYFTMHNYAVLGHYAGHLYNGMPPESKYERAIKAATILDFKAFTARQYASLLLDLSQFSKAEKLLRDMLLMPLDQQARNYLRWDLINVLIASGSSSLEEMKGLISDALDYFQAQDTQWFIADLFNKASEVANLEKNYSESLGYITKAISIYEELGIPEFLASAFIRKGTLLYTWAQDGQVQFYQAAIDTYQQALKTFTREDFPDVYAEIHHNLAVIYAEMPVEEKKRAMWSAFSATSFKESLAFYNKEQYPYEYAMVANNYANALLRYPPAKTGDNSEKAIHYYMEAIDIRTADKFPVERAHTLLNYLEACWRIHNINKTMERARYKDMLEKAREVKALTEDQELIQQAQDHMDQLSVLSVNILKN